MNEFEKVREQMAKMMEELSELDGRVGPALLEEETGHSVLKEIERAHQHVHMAYIRLQYLAPYEG